LLLNVVARLAFKPTEGSTRLISPGSLLITGQRGLNAAICAESIGWSYANSAVQFIAPITANLFGSLGVSDKQNLAESTLCR
jgi:hypothetical protein